MSIGDGLSLGLNSLGVQSYNYNDYLVDFLESQNKNVKYYYYSEKNISISELTNDIIYLKDRNLKDYLKTSNLIILSIGEKEILDDKNIKIIEEDLNNLVRELKKYNNNICLLSRYNINEKQYSKIKNINEVYKQIAHKNNIIYINIDQNNYYINAEYNYPTTNGHKEISKMIIKAMDIVTDF